VTSAAIAAKKVPSQTAKVYPAFCVLLETSISGGFGSVTGARTGLFALRGRKLGVAGTCNQLHNSPQHAHLYVLIRCAFLQRLARNLRIPSTKVPPRILMVVEVRDGEEAESASRDQVPF